MTCLISYTPVTGWAALNTKLDDAGSTEICQRFPISTTPENAAFSAVKAAAVTICEEVSASLMRHSPFPLAPGAVQDKAPNTVGIAMSPSGKCAAVTESVTPDRELAMNYRLLNCGFNK